MEFRTSPDSPLLLAHYTSIETAECVLRNDELWLSNPLYMNDLEEMRAGISIGTTLFSEFAQAVGQNTHQVETLSQAFNHYLVHLQTAAALDTYVFCLSEHELGDCDGLLSMWREYGRDGNGAALVFDTQKINYQPHSPLLISKVTYASPDERVSAMKNGLTEWARITKNAKPPDDQLYLAAYAAFNFVKTLALTTKHRGFAEEKEWRVVYVPERDPFGYLKSQLDYFLGPRGVEPKLKYKLGSVLKAEERSVPDLPTGSLSDILGFILLGPSVSSPLSKSAFIRMLHRINKGEYEDRVFPSTIPLRPKP